MNSEILIADDEPLARRSLCEQLRDLSRDLVIHEAPDGAKAIAIANTFRPGLIFLDIAMPGATGIEVLRQLQYEPKVVFTTAFDQYAITAFELGALDYLLKPFGRERLAKVMRRADASLGCATVPLISRVNESIEGKGTLSRIFVRDANRIVPIPLDSLERVQGADDYVTVFAADKEYLLNLRLSDLETHLRRANFLRIHRSHLINLESVISIAPYDAGRLEVVMKSGARLEFCTFTPVLSTIPQRVGGFFACAHPERGR
jgi:two-component system LytT family response regulator